MIEKETFFKLLCFIIMIGIFEFNKYYKFENFEHSMLF